MHSWQLAYLLSIAHILINLNKCLTLYLIVVGTCSNEKLGVIEQSLENMCLSG